MSNKEPDASDVVTGPVGSARLRDPATAPDEGAELENLPEIDPDLPPNPIESQEPPVER